MKHSSNMSISDSTVKRYKEVLSQYEDLKVTGNLICRKLLNRERKKHIDFKDRLDIVHSIFKLLGEETPPGDSFLMNAKNEHDFCARILGLAKDENERNRTYSTMFGKLVFVGKNPMQKTIDEWLLQDKFNWTQPMMMRYIKHTKDIIADYNWKEFKYISFEDFLNEPGILDTQGAFSDKQLRNKLKQKNYPKTKKYAVWTLNENWRQRIMDKSAFDFSFAVKSEPNSIRHIITSDLELYLLEAWIFYMIEPIIKDRSFFFYQTPIEQNESLIQIQGEIASGDKFISDDGSRFDTSFQSGMTKIQDSELISFIRKLGYDDELFGKYLNTRWKLQDNDMYNIKGGLVNSGNPSGDRGTTWRNSNHNEILARIITDELGISVKYRLIAGDDRVWNLGRIPDYKVKEIFENMCVVSEQLGVVINKRKSFYGAEAEFLKNYITKDFIGGDHLRIIKTLLWTTNLEDDYYGPYSRVDTWIKYMQRKRKLVDISIVAKDLNGLLPHISQSKLKVMLRTSHVLGGFGVYGMNTKGLVLDTKQMKTADTPVLNIKYKEEFKHFTSEVSSYLAFDQRVKYFHTPKEVIVDWNSLQPNTMLIPSRVSRLFNRIYPEPSAMGLLTINKINNTKSREVLRKDFVPDYVSQKGIDFDKRTSLDKHFIDSVRSNFNNISKNILTQIVDNGYTSLIGTPDPMTRIKYSDPVAICVHRVVSASLIMKHIKYLNLSKMIQIQLSSNSSTNLYNITNIFSGEVLKPAVSFYDFGRAVGI